MQDGYSHSRNLELSVTSSHRLSGWSAHRSHPNIMSSYADELKVIIYYNGA